MSLHEQLTDERIAHYRNRIAAALNKRAWPVRRDYEATQCLVDLFAVEKIGAEEWREICEDCEGGGVFNDVDGFGDCTQRGCDMCGGKGYTWVTK